MEHRKIPAALLLDTLVICGLLALVVAGAGLYSSALEAQQRHARQRSGLSYVQSQAALCRGGVDTGEEGLMLTQPDGNYVTYIYLERMNLCSQMIPVNSKLNPKNGDIICPASQLELIWVTPELLKVRTDAGCAYIRCVGGGGDG